MIIGVNNIFTSFYYITMLLCGATLSYMAIKSNVFMGDLIIVAKFFLGLTILICVIVFFNFLYKFRILIIDDNKVLSFYPFWFKKEKMDLMSIKKCNIENFSAYRETVYKRVVLSNASTSIIISDLEFENFEKLISRLKLDQVKKKEVDLKQAKSNLSNMNFNVFLLSGFIIFIVYNMILNGLMHILIISFFLCNIVLLYASTKRVLGYKRIINTEL